MLRLLASRVHTMFAVLLLPNPIRTDKQKTAAASLRHYFLVLRVVVAHYMLCTIQAASQSAEQKGLPMMLPVIGAKPVQWCVQLDDVGAKENIVAHLEGTEIWVRVTEMGLHCDSAEMHT